VEGQSFGNIKSFSGGGRFADVVAVRNSEGIEEKHPGPPRCEDIVVEVPMTSAPARQLAGQMWSGQAASVSGSVLRGDSMNTATSEIQFMDALITEVTIPACDAARRDPGHLTMRLSPSEVRVSKGSGKLPTERAAAGWNVSAFRLSVDGMDTKMVRRIEPLTVKQAAAPAGGGEERNPSRQPGGLTLPNLRFSLAESAADPWQAWFEESVVRGNVQERGGTLTLLAADLKTTLAEIRFHNLGIIRLTPVAGTAERPGEVVVELYCERMEMGK
jgi:hypothetical protein